MSTPNPLDARIERAIESELAVYRDKDLLNEDDRGEIARALRIRLQRAGVMADVKKTPERELARRHNDRSQPKPNNKD
jgi:hypothetical protein